MADFDDAADAELGAACNRLSAFTLPIPTGAVVDEASGLTEPDLVLILRALHRARKMVPIRMVKDLNELARPHAALSDAVVLRMYQETSGEPGDPEADALLAEIERRGLDV